MSSFTAKDEDEGRDDRDSRGKVFVVGTGPGAIDHLTVGRQRGHRQVNGNRWLQALR